jgi:signal transduction histidine kinase
MLWLREILAANQSLLTLVHVQAFFALGLSIVFLAHRTARLEISQGLTSLAIFGFCEALLAWSPVWLVDSSITAHWLRAILMGVGYAYLLAFGLSTLVPMGGRWWVQAALAGGLFVVWLIGLAVARFNGLSLEQGFLVGEIAARYLLVLPGGLLGAWGLRRETYRSIGRELLPLVKVRLRIAGLGLGFFALFGGMIGPAAQFFPVNWLNQEMFLNLTGIPVSLFRALCGIGMTYGFGHALGMVSTEVEMWLESMERIQALDRERERIGRELHDGTIQSIYAAGLMLEGARYSMATEPEAARIQLTRAIESLNRTIQDVRRYIFDLRGEMPDDDLETGLRKLLKDFRINTLLETELVVEGAVVGKLGAERRQHIFQIVREALTNAARHARARRVEVHLRFGARELRLSVSDDGVGLPALPIDGKGHGLRNIRERTRLLDGKLELHSAPGEGVTLVVTVPY